MNHLPPPPTSPRQKKKTEGNWFTLNCPPTSFWTQTHHFIPLGLPLDSHLRLLFWELGNTYTILKTAPDTLQVLQHIKLPGFIISMTSRDRYYWSHLNPEHRGSARMSNLLRITGLIINRRVTALSRPNEQNSCCFHHIIKKWLSHGKNQAILQVVGLYGSGSWYPDAEPSEGKAGLWSMNSLACSGRDNSWPTLELQSPWSIKLPLLVSGFTTIK